MRKSSIILLFCSMSMLAASHAQAGITLGATRVIFDAQNKEENLTVRNDGNNPILLQSWLDGGEGKDSVPFAVTPPLTKMGIKGQQLLRILYKGGGLPKDRESVVWLNVQEIPTQSERKNTLQIAVRQRIKVFYRPADLQGSAQEAASSLQWSLEPGGKGISVLNPSAYHVSMVQIRTGEGQEGLARERQMLAPKERLVIPLKKSLSAASVNLSFRSINDWGGQETYRATLQSSGSAQAIRTAE